MWLVLTRRSVRGPLYWRRSEPQLDGEKQGDADEAEVRGGSFWAYLGWRKGQIMPLVVTTELGCGGLTGAAAAKA